METTEKIVEAYVRYIKRWFTIPNIIESGVSISGGFSKLTNKPFSRDALKVRVKQASQRRTLGYFTERKFTDPGVLEALATYGFRPGNYTKVIVTWECEADVEEAAKAAGVELWYFPQLLGEIAKSAGNRRTYFTDDTLRTLQLMAMATPPRLP